MEENISRFISAIIAVFLLFIFPVYMAYEKKDDVSYALALNFTQDFVDKVRSKGYVTKELYDDYVKALYASGNTYKIDMEHEYISYDSSRVDGEVISSNRNSEIYDTNHIINILDNGQKYVMNVNDNFRVKITNTNVTPATIIYNIITINMSKNNVRLHVDYGGKIMAEKWFENGLYYSENGGIADGTGKVLNINITANDIGEGVDTQTGEIQDTELDKYLSNYANVGDYVDYPIKVLNGKSYNWRVIKVDRENKSVFIVSDTPYGANTYKKSSDKDGILRAEFTSYYGTARSIKLEDVVTNSDLLKKLLSGKEENNSTLNHKYTILTSNLVPDLVNINTSYWFSNSINGFTWHTETSNVVVHSGCSHSYYIRPVVELTPGIICTNPSDGDGSQGKPWQIGPNVASAIKLKESNLKVGDYVEYTSDNDVTETEIFGKKILKNPNAKWRVLKIDEYNNKAVLLYDLVSDNNNNDINYKSIKFENSDNVKSDDFFNNCVTELNSAFDRLYSDGYAKARHINFNDIKEYMESQSEGTVFTITSRLPKRFMNSDYDPYDKSKVEEWSSTPYSKITGEQSSDNITKTLRSDVPTANFDRSVNDVIKSVISSNKQYGFYILASVYAYKHSSYVECGIRIMGETQLVASPLIKGSISNVTGQFILRPIIELDLSQSVYILGAGTMDNPWRISR